MKKFVFALLFLLALNLFSQYIPGEKVRAEDNLSWTDSDGHSTNIFDEIFLQKNVVVLFWGGFG